MVSKDMMAVDDAIWEEPDWSRLTLPAELRVVHAGLFRRILAALVDAPLLLLLTVLAMIAASLAAVGGGTVAGRMTPDVEVFAWGAAIAMIFVVSLAYHVVCWGYGGQTPGQMLMRVQVVGRGGEQIGYGRAFLRWVGCVLSLVPFGLGFLLVLFHPHRRGLHDLLAGTYVARVDR